MLADTALSTVLRGVRLLGFSEEYAQLLYRQVVGVAGFPAAA
jgi:hypothetical protein